MKCILIINKKTGRSFPRRARQSQWDILVKRAEMYPEEFEMKFEDEETGMVIDSKELPGKKHSRTELKRMSMPKKLELAKELGIEETDPAKIIEAIIKSEEE